MQSILFFIVVFLSNIIQGITGFAGTVLAMPFAILLLGIDVAKPILNIVTWVACVFIVFESYKFIQWKEFLKMTLIMMIGVFVGEYIYTLFPVDLLLIIYGWFIILIALKGILIKKTYNVPEWLLIGVIILAGIIHGMFLSGGPLLIIYAVKKLPEKNEFRATLSPVWVVLNTYLFIRHWGMGLLTPTVVQYSLISIPILIVAIWIGKILYHKMSQKAFMLLSYILLLISGISLLI